MITKSLLALSVVCLAGGTLLNSGLVNLHGRDEFYIVFPLGAVFTGLYMITRLMEKESAAYDAEQRAIHATVEGSAHPSRH